MNYSRYVLIVLFLTFFAVSYGFAQEDVLRPHGKKGTAESQETPFKRNPIILGIEGGLNINLFSQTMAWDFTPGYYAGTVWNGLKSANGLSPHFGALIDVPINKTFSVQLRAAYDMKNYGVSASGTDIDFNGVEHPFDLRVDVTSSYITITPLLRINATDKLFFTVGPTFHFLSGDIKETWTPKSLDGTDLNNFYYWYGYFPAGTTSGSIIGRDTASQKSTRVGIEGGIGYKIPLTKSIYLVPQGRFQFMLTPVFSDSRMYFVDQNSSVVGTETSTNKIVHTIQLALALWFEL